MKPLIKEFFKRWKKTIKTRLLLLGGTFLLLTIALGLLKVSWYGLISLGIVLLDFLPFVGAGAGMIPWSLVLLFKGDTKEGLILLFLYLILFIGSRLLEPILFGKATGVHPLLTFLFTFLAIGILGPWGAVLGSLLSTALGVALEYRAVLKRAEGNPSKKE